MNDSKRFAFEPESSSPDAGMLEEVLNTIPTRVLVVDRQSRIRLANSAFAEFAGKSSGEILGQRPGDALSCLHALDSGAGCTTSDYCSMCGLRQALGEDNAVRECRILQRREDDGSALDLRVWVRPLTPASGDRRLITFDDIRDEKRRRSLERIFFHDVLNTAGILQGYVSTLRTRPQLATSEMLDTLASTSAELVDEITAQRQLLAAENRELEPRPSWVQAREVVEGVLRAYGDSVWAQEKILEIEAGFEEAAIYTDATLLRRVLGNLVKNALEATPAGGRVSVHCSKSPDAICFEVRNPAVMELQVQLQVFKRSFSTKGEGRGLGTYGVKLLTERYLAGGVSFHSNRSEGTIFRVCLPPVLQPGASSSSFPSSM